MFHYPVTLIQMAMVNYVYVTSHWLLSLLSDAYNQLVCISKMRQKMHIEEWIDKVREGKIWPRKENSGITYEPLAFILFLEM